MPKIIKGLEGRKPPAPSRDRSDIDEWLNDLSPGLQPIVRDLDQAIQKTIPNLQYAFKAYRPYYGLPKPGWIIQIAAYQRSVNVLFFGGADFKSPPPLGNTDRTRYIKLTSLEEARQPEIHKWIKEARRTPGWK